MQEIQPQKKTMDFQPVSTGVSLWPPGGSPVRNNPKWGQEAGRRGKRAGYKANCRKDGISASWPEWRQVPRTVKSYPVLKEYTELPGHDIQAAHGGGPMYQRTAQEERQSLFCFEIKQFVLHEQKLQFLRSDQ